MSKIIFLGFAPIVALIHYFYLKNQHHKTLHLMIQAFWHGMICVAPVLLFKFILVSEQIATVSLPHSVFFSSIPEELIKWGLFLVVFFRHQAFNKPIDGITYAIAVSLGFAVVENIIYLLIYSGKLVLSKAIFTTFSYVLLGILMGYFMGKAKFATKVKRILLAGLALLLSMSLHILYDYGFLYHEGKLSYLNLILLSLYFISMVIVKKAQTRGV